MRHWPVNSPSIDGGGFGGCTRTCGQGIKSGEVIIICQSS